MASLRAGHSSVNGCRLGPPESVSSGRNHFLVTLSPERHILQSERKRRLLHNFSVRKMNSECTIFLI